MATGNANADDQTEIAVSLVLQVVDELFDQYRESFGKDYETYRGHVHRVVSLVASQVEIPDRLVRPLGVAAFFHDAGIWIDQTWDYLEPSATQALTALGESEHSELVKAIISEHHRVRRARHSHPMVEAFRLADRADLCFGIPPIPGVSRGDYRLLVEKYPTTGFRAMLFQAFGRGLRERPWKPFPMIKF